MSRASAGLLFSLALFVGCGGRTDSLDFGGGASGPGGSGAAGFGADSGAPNGGFAAGAGAPAGGAPSFAGGPMFAGAPSIGGSPHFGGAPAGGAPSFAGGPMFAGAPSIGGSPPVGGAPSFGGSGGTGGSGATGGVIVDACVAVSSTSCEKCLCTSCPSQVVGCFSDTHCIAIFACIIRTGCQNLGCYFNGPCKQTIDDNGGLEGSAVAEVFGLASCAAQSQNSCACN